MEYLLKLATLLAKEPFRAKQLLPTKWKRSHQVPNFWQGKSPMTIFWKGSSYAPHIEADKVTNWKASQWKSFTKGHPIKQDSSLTLPSTYCQIMRLPDVLKSAKVSSRLYSTSTPPSLMTSSTRLAKKTRGAQLHVPVEGYCTCLSYSILCYMDSPCTWTRYSIFR